jgi:hypothetical protein
MSEGDWLTIVASPEQRNPMTSIFIFNWIFLLALFPIAFFWLRRAYRILVKQDFSEVALKKGMPPANADKYAPYEMVINLVGGAVMVVVLVAVLGFQALTSEDWIAIAGSTLWIKLLASFALSRQAHGLGPKTKTKQPAADSHTD